MFATWILCIFFVLIAPYLLVEAAVLRTRKCAQLGAPRGYRSELARSSQTAWDYAQKLCSMRYMLGGIVMAIAALAILFACPSKPSPACISLRWSSFCLKWSRFSA